MSRMLDALKQVDAKSTAADAAPSAAQPSDARPAGDRAVPNATGEPAQRVDTLLQELEQRAAALAREKPTPPIVESNAAQAPAQQATVAPAVEEAPSVLPFAPASLDASSDWLAGVAGADLRPGSRLGGQYRRLRDRILSQVPRGVPVALLFTSPDREAGTTTTVIHLACVLAEVTAGDTLIVDANLRNPELAARLNIDAEFGLGDVLADRVAWQQSVVRIAPGRVHVLGGGGAGHSVEMPAEPERLARLVADFKRRYRVVLIDAGTFDSDSVACWSGMCDGTYLLLELSSTPPEAAARSIDRVRAAGGKTLGCVLTRGGLAA